MKSITLHFSDSDARGITYSLRKRYRSKAGLARLITMAIRHEMAEQAKIDLKGLGIEVLEATK